MDETPSFGYWVRRRRKALDLTQADLARCVSCAVVTLKKIESDARRPSDQMAERLADCLDIPPATRTPFLQAARAERSPARVPLPADASERLAARPGLPVPPTSLVGRAADVAGVAALLRRPNVRLVTLTGPGGVGKTRLGLAVAGELLDDFLGAVTLVPLAPATSPVQVAAAIASALGVRRERGQALEQALIAHLDGRRTLLLLDNFEHLLPAGPFLSQLLATLPGLRILVTSRALLHLSGEWEYRVHPLTLPLAANGDISYADVAASDAVRLFVERAEAAQPGFALTPSNASDVGEICRRLDGLPLAIELAAARLNLLAPRVLLARLADRFGLLTGGPRDVPARQRTLAATVLWSYDLLSPPARLLLARLSVFRGGWTLEAAEDVSASPAAQTAVARHQLLDALGELAGNSLLQSLEGESGVRFTMLETVRELAAVQLASEGDVDTVKLRHLAHYRALAEQAQPALMQGTDESWLGLLAAEHDNIATALAWALAGEAAPGVARSAVLEEAARLASCMWYFWYVRGQLDEGRRWLALALDKIPKRTALRAQVLTAAGAAAWEQGDYLEAEALLQESLGIRRGLGDRAGLAEATHFIGHLVFDQQQYDRALELFRESLALYGELSDDANCLPLIGDLGLVAYHQGDYAAARASFEQVLAQANAHESRDGIAEMQLRLGDLDRLTGDHEQAAQRYRQGLQLFRELGENQQIAGALHKLGQVVLQMGDAAQARKLLRQSLSMQIRCGNKQGLAECLAALSGVAIAEGQTERGAALSGAAAALLRRIGAPLAPADRLAWEQEEKLGQARLGLSVYAACRTSGEAMAIEQAIALAQST